MSHFHCMFWLDLLNSLLLPGPIYLLLTTTSTKGERVQQSCAVKTLHNVYVLPHLCHIVSKSIVSICKFKFGCPPGFFLLHSCFSFLQNISGPASEEHPSAASTIAWSSHHYATVQNAGKQTGKHPTNVRYHDCSSLRRRSCEKRTDKLSNCIQLGKEKDATEALVSSV